MRAIVTNSADLNLGAPGTHYPQGYPIVCRSVDALAEWGVVFIEVWKRGVLRLTLKGYSHPMGHEVVVCYCKAGIFRVAKETHVLA